MKLRSVPYILRIYNGKRQNLMEELYSELLLFAPWRNKKAKNPYGEIKKKWYCVFTMLKMAKILSYHKQIED